MRKVIPLAIAASMLAGCANPILQVEAPGYSTQKSPPPAGEPDSMAEALQKLNHMHATYYEAIRDQTGSAQNATTGLVWLGTVIAGLAAGKAHHDAILGTSLVGGTTYGLARTQLDARRIDVWTSGMEALDCAKEAAQPLYLGKDRSAELSAVRLDLAYQSSKTRQDIDTVKAELTPEMLKLADLAAAAQAAIQKSEEAAKVADATRVSVANLIDASRGGTVSVAVDRIHSGVTAAMKDIAVDPRSIKQLVGGVGGLADTFAPGAGIESLVAGAFAAFKVAQAGKGGAAAQAAEDSKLLDAAMKALRASTQKLAAEQQRANDLLRGVDVAQVNAALKKCGVAAPATALLLTPNSLSFTKGSAATKGFAISGGTPPYVVEALDGLPDGLSPVFSGGLADRAQVKATAAVPADEYRLLISDSGTTKRSQQLVIKVEAPRDAPSDKPAAPAAPGSDNAEVDAAWTALIAAMTEPEFERQIGSVTFSVASAKRVGGKLRVTLKCSQPDAALNAADVRERLTAADKKATQSLLKATALDATFSQIDLQTSAPCVKG